MEKIISELKKIIDEIKKNNDSLKSNEIKTIDQKIEEYFDWYEENILLYKCRANEREEELENLKKLINKFVVWYEIRYPDYELSRKIPFYYDDNSREMNEILKEQKQVPNDFDWSTFYDKKVFLKSLSQEEKELISGDRYNRRMTDLWFENQDDRFYRVQLTISNKFNVTKAFMPYFSSGDSLSKEELQGKSIDEAIQILKSYRYILNDRDNDFFQYQKNLRENPHKIFDVIMYSMIKSGGRYTGPRRALLFAQEFHLNMDIPMSYGVISEDDNTLYLIDEYLKNGGHEDLICCVDYFRKDKKVMPLNDIIEKFLNDEPSYEVQREISSRKYDLEEQLVTILNSQIDPKELENEKIRKYRIERKLKGN